MQRLLQFRVVSVTQHDLISTCCTVQVKERTEERE